VERLAGDFPDPFVLVAAHLWAAPPAPDGLSLASGPTMLLEQTHPWQLPTMEGPAMVRLGHVYELFYGADDWATASAGIGFATCDGPLGPCSDRTPNGPWLASSDGAAGPSGPSVSTDRNGARRFASHAWTGAAGYERGGTRSLHRRPAHRTRRPARAGVIVGERSRGARAAEVRSFGPALGEDEGHTFRR
jgi:hypothetical protein